MTRRAELELSPGQHQNRANKTQGGVMLWTGWRAEQAKQEAEWEATQNDQCCRNNCRVGNGAADDLMEGRTRAGRRVGKGQKGWMVNARERRKAGKNGV